MKGDSGAMLILNVQVKELFMCQVAYFSRKLSVYLPLTEFGDNYNFLLLRKLLKLLKVPWAQVVNKRKFDNSKDTSETNGCSIILFGWASLKVSRLTI